MNLPNALTLVRLILAPILLPVLIFYLLPYNILWINGVLAGLFLLFSITDFLDGYLARRLDKVTYVGKTLDPIADKFLMYSTLVALLAVHKIFFAWVVIFIGREFFMMGLRLIALERGLSLSVSLGGKLKTALQMAFVTVCIFNPYHALPLHTSVANQLETGLLVAALFITVWSAYGYWLSLKKQMREKNVALESEDKVIDINSASSDDEKDDHGI